MRSRCGFPCVPPAFLFSRACSRVQVMSGDESGSSEDADVNNTMLDARPLGSSVVVAGGGKPVPQEQPSWRRERRRWKSSTLGDVIDRLEGKVLNSTSGLRSRRHDPRFDSVWHGHLLEQYIRLLTAIDTAATAVSLHYVLGFGSLLGYARARAFTPWDDDHDILIPHGQPDLERLFLSKLRGLGVDHVRGHKNYATDGPSYNTEPDLLAAAHKVGLTWVPIKLWLHNDSTPFANGMRHEYPYVDVFYYRAANGLLQVFDSGKSARAVYSGELRVQRVQFGPVVAQVFQDSVVVDLVGSMYGSSWCSTCKSSKFNHSLETDNRNGAGVRLCVDVYPPGMLNCLKPSSLP